MKYTVSYEFFGTTYLANFDCLQNAKLYLCALPEDYKAEIVENGEGSFDAETGYFSGFIETVKYNRSR
jgi:hypothetical protein